jgi:hypothetical protein
VAHGPPLDDPCELREEGDEIEGRDDLDAAVGDLLLDLAFRQQGIEADHHAARLEHREVEHDEVGRVGQHEPDARAGKDPDRLQPPGGAGDQPGHVAVAVAAAQEIQAGVGGEARHGVVEQGVKWPGHNGAVGIHAGIGPRAGRGRARLTSTQGHASPSRMRPSACRVQPSSP